MCTLELYAPACVRNTLNMNARDKFVWIEENGKIIDKKA